MRVGKGPLNPGSDVITSSVEAEDVDEDEKLDERPDAETTATLI